MNESVVLAITKTAYTNAPLPPIQALANKTVDGQNDFRQVDRMNKFILCVIEFATAPVFVFLNVMFVLVVLKNRRLRTNSNKLLLALAAIDILNGGLSHVLVAIDRLLFSQDRFNYTLDVVACAVAFLFTGASFVTVVTISLDRYFAVVHPFFYERAFRVHRVLRVNAALCLLWTFIVIWLVVLHYQPSIIYMTSFAVIVTGAFIIAFAYFKIFLASREITRKQLSISTSYKEVKNLLSTSKAASVSIYIALALLACYCPLIVVTTYHASFRLTHSNRHVLVIVYPWTQMFAYMNGFCNALIYYWRIPDVRHHFSKMLHLTKQKVDNTPSCRLQKIDSLWLVNVQRKLRKQRAEEHIAFASNCVFSVSIGLKFM